MILGVRAHDFGKLSVDDLANKIASKGFSSIQLALTKAIREFDSDQIRLSPGMAHYIGNTFAKHNIQIAVLGCYINPIHPDPDIRKRLLERFKEHIRYARDFGCSIVGTETGSLNADYSYNPENHTPKALQLFTNSLSELVEEAEKFGVFVGIEGVESHVVSNPAKIKLILDTVKSNNLQVIFDPVNLLNAQNYQNQDHIINESFELFGDRVVIIHAKDFLIANGQKKVVTAGDGILNFELLLKSLKPIKPYINILLEDTHPETVEQNITFIKNIYNRT